tara:strand:+ start:1070 stop:1996 length:927 start_codon:yes stop_codon:yes gene_type:complete
MATKEEILQEMKLRRLVRKAIKLRESKRRSESVRALQEEEKLRTVIRALLKEAKEDTEPAPHSSTAVNFLDDILDVLKDVMERNLRKLTSKGEQRESFRDNMLRGLQSIFSGVRAGGIDIGDIRQKEADALAEAVDIDIVDAAIEDPDVVGTDELGGDEEETAEEPKKTKAEEAEEEEEAAFQAFKVEGSNPVGARHAYKSLENSAVESAIKEKIKMFGEDDPDNEINDLEEYLLYNANVWFNIYEKELAAQMGQEPAWDVSKTVIPRPEGAKVAPEAEEAAGGTEGEDEPAAGGDVDAALADALGGA